MNFIKIPQTLIRILDILESVGYKAYPVGGCIRDSLMGIKPKDWDVATSALPDQVKVLFKDTGYKIIDTGLKHGTVSILAEGNLYEVTTFRTDGTYTDNRRPDEVKFVTDIEDDLSRRDFTVNAIAYDRNREKIIDPFGGETDIRKKTIRCVGDPDLRFREDSLRILRALRFASVLGFNIENATAMSMKKSANLLDNISRERIYSELKVTLCGENIGSVLGKYRGILARVIPELIPMFDFPQRNPYHCYDVWEHTIQAVQNIPAKPVLRLAGLFHDCGKPATHSVDYDLNGLPIDHFYGHETMSAKLAEKALLRLKADNRTKDMVVYLVKHHGDTILSNKKSVKRKLAKISYEFDDVRSAFDMLIMVKRADVSAQAIHVRQERQRALDEIFRLAEEIFAENECFGLKNLAINGNDVISLGFTGPDVGKILRNVLNAVISDKLSNDRDAIFKYINIEFNPDTHE